ncbi:transcription initiation factor TFIID subunit 5 [Enteropsectra breve]|nr:transcription initiation factor TFIID subunit 5 [Enteropsectra breve]
MHIQIPSNPHSPNGSKAVSTGLEKPFTKLKAWIEDSLDLFKNDLLPLLYPVYIHIYLDLMAKEEIASAKNFLNTYKSEFPDKTKEIGALDSLNSSQHIHEDPVSVGFQSSKYFLVMGRYAYDLLINFLEENNMLYILKIMNQYMEIKAQSGPREEQRTGIDVNAENISVNLATSLVSNECEEAILASEQYKYDHLETYVQSLKKQRESRKVESKIRPTPSLICAEIEKLKDLCKRVSVNKTYLPSICCYTVQNTYGELTCSEISEDSLLLACGYENSYIDVHSLSKEMLKTLKSSTELAKIDVKKEIKKKEKAENDPYTKHVESSKSQDFKMMEDKWDEVGNVKRLIGHSGPVYSVKFAYSNKFLLSASQDCTVRLWSLDLFKTVAIYKAHTFPIWSVDIAPNDFYFASGGADRQAIVWCTKSSKPERLIISSLSDVTVVKFHPNGNYLFTGSADHKVRMHDIETAKMVRVFCGHTDGISCLAVSHCGKYLLSGSKDKNVILWEIETSKILGKFVGHSAAVYSVSFSYFGTIICSTAADNSVRLWDMSDVSANTGVYYTKNTPIQCAKFGYRNIISCVGSFSG